MKHTPTHRAILALAAASSFLQACGTPESGADGDTDGRQGNALVAATRINFQPAGVPTPSGYLADTGAVYGAHGSLHYGWSVPHTDVTRTRGASADPLLDTLVHFHAGAKWEIEVPSGDYSVTVSVGDPAYASTYTLRAEGVPLVDDLALGVNQFRKVTRVVHVTDGRLTLDQGGLAEKSTRLDYVEIARSPYALSVSSFADRHSPKALQGAALGGDAYVFTTPDTGIKQVDFWLDDPTAAGAPLHSEHAAPFDFVGADAVGAASPLGTAGLGPGAHTISARLTATDGTTLPLVSGSFTVTPPPDPITWHSGITIGTGDLTENADMIAWRSRPNGAATVNTAYIPLEGLSHAPPGSGPYGLAGWGGSGWFNLWTLPAGKAYSDFPGMLLFQVGPAGPATVATQAEYDQLMMDGANGLHDAAWQEIGKSWKSYGRNQDNTILWLGHEFNGTWYHWNPANIGCGSWIKMFRRAALAFKSTGATARIAWGYAATTHNTKGGDFAVKSAWECYPGDDVVDVIAVDHYDFGMWPLTTDWKAYRHWPDSHAAAADFARAHGKKVAVGEWQIIQDAAGHAAADRDNPAYIQMMYDYFRDNADVLIFESMFHINGYNGEKKYIYPVDATNTKAATLYKSLWKKP